MKFINCILIFFIIISNFSYAGTRHPLIGDQNYINFGKKFPYVGRLIVRCKKGELSCASSVAINDRRILTAAHVVNNADVCLLQINNKEILINKIICHKEFNDHIFGWNDIAICSLKEDIDLKFYPDLYKEKNEINELCTISGFGLNGTFESGCINSDEQRRAGSNRIDQIQQGLLICSPSRDRGSQDFTSLEFLIASGDSGGGLFIGNRLAGINSCVISIDKKPNSSFTDESGHTRISDHIDWINIQSVELDSE